MNQPTTEGYIFLHRKVLKSDLWALTPTQIVVATVCLLKAQWQDAQIQGFTVKRGQWLTHYHEIKKLCPRAISTSQVRHAIRRLASSKVGFLNTRVVTRFGHKFLLITVCKYEDYQSPALWITGGGTTRVAPRVSHGCHTGVTAIKEEVEEVEEIENNRRAPVDNSREDGTDRTGEIQSLVSDMAETKALGNIALVDRILEETGDRESQAYYERMVRAIDHMAIEKMLGAVKEARRLGEIKKSPGALLKHLMKLEIKSSRSARQEARKGVHA